MTHLTLLRSCTRERENSPCVVPDREYETLSLTTTWLVCAFFFFTLPGESLIMPGEYILNISGQQKKHGAFEKLVSQLRPRIETFAPGSEINLFNFARLNFRIQITGVPSRFDFIDNLVKSMKGYIIENLRKWKYDITVSYIDTGGENGKTS